MSKIFDAIELPKDIVLGIPYVTMYGNLELIIENHRGIRCFNDELVEILSKSNIISVKGRNMSISEYTKDSIVVEGYIEQISFVSLWVELKYR